MSKPKPPTVQAQALKETAMKLCLACKHYREHDSSGAVDSCTRLGPTVEPVRGATEPGRLLSCNLERRGTAAGECGRLGVFFESRAPDLHR
jgi:hypothetical protein